MPSKRQKGSQFERDMSRAFSLWVTNQKSDDCFWRSASSGGAHTRRQAKGGGMASQAGDLRCTAEGGVLFSKLFSVECKFVKDATTHNLFFGNAAGKTVEFWLQASRDAKATGRRPILALRQNRIGEVLIVDQKTANCFIGAAWRDGVVLNSLVDVNQPVSFCVFRMSDVFSLDFKKVMHEAFTEGLEQDEKPRSKDGGSPSRTDEGKPAAEQRKVSKRTKRSRSCPA
jgi:hypothetical protein